MFDCPNINPQFAVNSINLNSSVRYSFNPPDSQDQAPLPALPSIRTSNSPYSGIKHKSQVTMVKTKKLVSTKLTSTSGFGDNVLYTHISTSTIPDKQLSHTANLTIHHNSSVKKNPLWQPSIDLEVLQFILKEAFIPFYGVPPDDAIFLTGFWNFTEKVSDSEVKKKSRFIIINPKTIRKRALVTNSASVVKPCTMRLAFVKAVIQASKG